MPCAAFNLLVSIFPETHERDVQHGIAAIEVVTTPEELNGDHQLVRGGLAHPFSYTCISPKIEGKSLLSIHTNALMSSFNVELSDPWS